MLNTAQGNLVMIGLNTIDPKVFWNGKEIQNLSGIQVACELGKETRVILKVKEDADLAEMQSAGVTIRRVV